MSPPRGPLTRDSGPLRISTGRISTNLVKRDSTVPEPPSVEPLTLCTDDSNLLYDTEHSEQNESVVQSILGVFRLPSILESILRVTDKGGQLNKRLKSALG
jgi:hypothetical protein